MSRRRYWIVGYTLPGDTDWQVFDADARGSFASGRYHRELNNDPNLKGARIFAFTIEIDEHVDETDEAENEWINENVWALIPEPYDHQESKAVEALRRYRVNDPFVILRTIRVGDGYVFLTAVARSAYSVEVWVVRPGLSWRVELDSTVGGDSPLIVVNA